MNIQPMPFCLSFMHMNVCNLSSYVPYRGPCSFSASFSLVNFLLLPHVVG